MQSKPTCWEAADENNDETEALIEEFVETHVGCSDDEGNTKKDESYGDHCLGRLEPRYTQVTIATHF